MDNPKNTLFYTEAFKMEDFSQLCPNLVGCCQKKIIILGDRTSSGQVMSLPQDLSGTAGVADRDAANDIPLLAAATAVGWGIPRHRLDNVTSRSFVTSQHYSLLLLLLLPPPPVDKHTVAAAAVLTLIIGGTTLTRTSNLSHARDVCLGKEPTQQRGAPPHYGVTHVLMLATIQEIVGKAVSIINRASTIL